MSKFLHLMGLLCFAFLLGLAAGCPEGPDEGEAAEAEVAEGEGESEGSEGEGEVVGTEGELQVVELIRWEEVKTAPPNYVNILFQALRPSGVGVEDLRTEDFEVLEDEQRVSPTESNNEIKKWDRLPYTFYTVLMLDTSRSVADYLEAIKRDARTLVNTMGEKQEIAVYSFSEEVQRVVDFTGIDGQQDILDAIDTIALGVPSTNLYGAVIEGARQWTDVYALDGISQGALVLLTDGSDTTGLHSLQEALSACGSKRCYTIGKGTEIDADALGQLGNAGYFPLTDFSQLEDTFAEIQADIDNYANSFYLLRYNSPKRGDNSHSLSLYTVPPFNSNTLSGSFNSAQFYSVMPGVCVNDGYDNHEGINQSDIIGGPGQQITLNVHTYFGEPDSDPVYTATVGDDALCRVASIDGETITLEAVYPGQTTLTIEDIINGFNITLDITVWASVPDVYGLPEEDAREALEAAGLMPGETVTYEYGTGIVHGRVSNTSPTAGTALLLDSTVDLRFSFVPETGVSWSSYLGGSGLDRGSGIALDDEGNVLVTGWTHSAGWISGGWDTSLPSYQDAFVVKLTPGGAHAWSSYLGGYGNDAGYGVAVDGAGNVLVTGGTHSSGWVSNGWDTTCEGGAGFVVKLTPLGAHVWSSYLGGSGDEEGHGIAVDGAGNVLVTGYTTSMGWVSGGWDTAYEGGNGWSYGRDAFVVRLSSSGAHVWSSYLGGGAVDEGEVDGNGDDEGCGIAVDGAGNALVTGYTESSGWVSGGWDTVFDGGSYGKGPDAFVAKFSPSGRHVWSSYLGGSEDDEGCGIAVDGAGNILLTGNTRSSGWVSGGWDTVFNGGLGEGFVAKLTSSGAHAWSSYLGGGGYKESCAITVDGGGNVLVTGLTSSSGWVSGGWDTTLEGSYDAFVVQLTSSGVHAWSSYLGGDDSDSGAGIVVDGNGNVLVAGATMSWGWVSGGWDTTHGSDGLEGEEAVNWDAFVAKIAFTSPEGSEKGYPGESTE